MRYEGVAAVVVGLGMTGAAAAKKLAELGACVTVFDNTDSDAVRSGASQLAELGVSFKVGELSAADLEGVEMVVVSPGVPPGSPSFAAAAAAGVETIGEIELASRLCGGTILAVTGTNGKTTTATLIGEVFKAAGRDTVVAGNIAPAFVSMLKEDDGQTTYVLEVSSFQLATTKTFRPHVAVVLNVTPDHLNWHGTLDEYLLAKARIFSNQDSSDFAVLNFDDERARLLGAGARAQVVPFSKRQLESGVCVEKGWIIHRRGAEESRIMPVGELKVRGSHNVENALAATAAAAVCGVPAADIARALAAFEGVEHRLEKVAVVDGVIYWNDSKATNPDAAVKALEAFEERIIILLGGRNKGNPFDELARVAVSRAKLAVTFGEAGPDIDRALARAGASFETAGSMAEALEIAASRASAGENVVLSPACASFDEFDNFEQRGTVFKDIVAHLGGDLP